MIDTIKSETKKTMYGCCKRHAEKKGLAITDVQLSLGVHDDSVTYWVYEKYSPVLQLDILGVLGVKFDLTMIKSKLAPQFILKSLIRFAQQYKVEVHNTKVLCIPFTNELGKPDVHLYLYNGSEYLETITFENLFREDDIELLMQ